MAYDKVVDSTILDGYFSDIADAIRDKDGSQNTYTPAQMPQAIEDIPSGGGSIIDDLVAGTASGNLTISGLEHLNALLIFDRTYNTNVTSLTFPDLLTSDTTNGGGLTGGSQNQYDSNLQTINLPKCTTINLPYYRNDRSKGKFGKLQQFNAPNLQTLYGAFNMCSSLTSINLPELLTVPSGYTFYYCSALQTVNLPKLTSLAANMFTGCSSLQTITLDNASSVGGSNVFQDCSNLQSIRLPKIQFAAYLSNMFSGCTNILEIDLGNSNLAGGAFGNTTFVGCASLKALVLRYGTVNSLNSTASFNNSSIAAGTGYIYVPRSLVATYESATNWSTYAGQFKAIEDYTSDGTIDGPFVLPS